MMHGWGFTGGRGGYPQRFEEQYHCYSVAYADKAHLEAGDKILLPPSAFDTLARLQVDYPMLFRLECPSKGTMTHSGVLEFTAEEGSCYIPFWMMQNLLMEEGDIITVTNASLPKATFVKLQPQHVDFLDISNPRAVLETALRSFSCVTKGDVICVPYNSRNYFLEIKEVKPKDAACIIETDCNVDFDAPVGYKEPSRGSTGSSQKDASLKSSSACPSPTMSSTSSVPENLESIVKGPRIVNGQIIRPDQPTPEPEVALAERTGSTGVQANAAIPVKAPEVDYWAVDAGDGARLDGKSPAALKDKDGTELDVRQLRAEAAAKRAVELQKQQQEQTSSSSLAAMEESANAAAAPVTRRKSRVGSKYSRLKSSAAAFQGSAKSLDEN